MRAGAAEQGVPVAEPGPATHACPSCSLAAGDAGKTCQDTTAARPRRSAPGSGGSSGVRGGLGARGPHEKLKYSRQVLKTQHWQNAVHSTGLGGSSTVLRSAR